MGTNGFAVASDRRTRFFWIALLFVGLALVNFGVGKWLTVQAAEAEKPMRPAISASLPDPVADHVRTGLDHPVGVAIAPNGRLFVLIWGNTGSDGQPWRQGSIQSWPSVTNFFDGAAADIVLGKSGAVQVSNPESIAVDAEGRLYVSDTYNSRLFVYNNVSSTGQQPSFVFGSEGQSNLL